MTNKKETVVEMLRRIYKDIDSKQTKKYGKNFIADLVLARPEINKQFKLLIAAGVDYSDEIAYKVLENVGLKKYF
jgi:hypothetical protein